MSRCKKPKLSNGNVIAEKTAGIMFYAVLLNAAQELFIFSILTKVRPADIHEVHVPIEVY